MAMELVACFLLIAAQWGDGRQNRESTFTIQDKESTSNCGLRLHDS